MEDKKTMEMQISKILLLKKKSPIPPSKLQGKKEEMKKDLLG